MAIPVNSTIQTQIANLYIAILGRNPEPAGFGYWCDMLANGNGSNATLNAITLGFSNSPEFIATYSGQTTSAAVTLMYQNVLNRAPDANGLAYWTAQVQNYTNQGYTNSQALALTGNQLITAAAANTGTADQTLILAKEQAAIASGTTAPTTTYTLTTAAETISGANITVNGYIDGTTAANSTLRANDSLTATSGTNILNISTSNDDVADATNGAAITGFQTANIRSATATKTATLDATKIAGLTAVNSNLSSGIVTVTGLTSGATGGVIGNATLANGASNFGWGATVTAATLNISGGVTAGTVTTSGTLLAANTVNSTGAANVLGALTLGAAVTSLTLNATTGLTTGAITNTGAAALTSLVINGAGAVNTSGGALQSTVTTVNASGNSGGVTIALGSAVTQKVTGSSGNDVITTGSLVLTTGSVDAGAGTADVLDIGTNVANVATSTLAAKYTNFEILRVNGTLDASLVAGINAIQLSGATNSITNLSATQAAAISARANIGDTTLTLATATGTSDVLTITNGLGTTTAAATTIGTLTATGFETINLIANPGASAATGADRTSTIAAITDTSLTAVNLTGTAWTVSTIASTKATTWTASALTGNGASTPVGLTISATDAAFAGSIVNGSALRDSITMNSSTGVTFNLGDGNDIFSTTTSLLLPSGASTDNTVNGGDGTSDQLVFTGASTATDTTFTKVSGFESLQLAGGAVNNSVTGLAAGFTGAFATGVTVTDTATQSAAQTYTWASGLYGQNVTLTHASSGTGALADSNQSITTGAGNDTVTLTTSAFVGGEGSISISTGAGNDTISWTGKATLMDTAATVQAVTINGGAGADTITVSHVNGTAGTGLLANVSFTLAAGQSSTTAWDTITGFLKADGTHVSDTLDFSNAVLTAYVATAASGYSAAELTVAVSAVGAVTFAGTAASGLTLAQQIAAVQSVVTTNNGDTAYWTNGSNTYVFNNETAGDVVVQLVGSTGITALVTTNAVTANAVFIA